MPQYFVITFPALILLELCSTLCDVALETHPSDCLNVLCKGFPDISDLVADHTFILFFPVLISHSYSSDYVVCIFISLIEFMSHNRL